VWQSAQPKPLPGMLFSQSPLLSWSASWWRSLTFSSAMSAGAVAPPATSAARASFNL
jgi:hypothetical protein